MNILFDINHPAHVHYFRNAISILQSQGHQITITSREKDVTTDVLDGYHLPHRVLSKSRKGLLWLAWELIVRQCKLAPILLKNKINICVSSTGACSVHICKILSIPTLVFYDTETAKLQNKLSIPLATRYITPESYMKEEGSNHETYKGVQELAYLHPKYFSPDENILKTIGVSKEDKYIVLRFVAWAAAHDIGERGMRLEFKRTLINKLKDNAKIFIISEDNLPEEFLEYQYTGPVEKVHDLMNFASLFIGEGATMASECACLGTPSIYVNSIKLGSIKECEKYGLVFDLDDEESILNKAIEILNTSDNTQWQKKKEKFLNEHTDVTEYFVDSILKYARK